MYSWNGIFYSLVAIFSRWQCALLSIRWEMYSLRDSTYFKCLDQQKFVQLQYSMCLCACGGKWWCWWIWLMSQRISESMNLTPCSSESSLWISIQLCYRHRSIRLRKNSQRLIFVDAVVVVVAYFSSYMMFGHFDCEYVLIWSGRIKIVASIFIFCF